MYCRAQDDHCRHSTGGDEDNNTGLPGDGERGGITDDSDIEDQVVFKDGEKKSII